MIGHKQKLKHPETHNFSSKIAKNRTLDAQMVIFSQKWDFQLKLAFPGSFEVKIAIFEQKFGNFHSKSKLRFSIFESKSDCSFFFQKSEKSEKLYL